jgi:hypothetical protein
MHASSKKNAQNYYAQNSPIFAHKPPPKVILVPAFYGPDEVLTNSAECPAKPNSMREFPPFADPEQGCA